MPKKVTRVKINCPGVSWIHEKVLGMRAIINSSLVLMTLMATGLVFSEMTGLRYLPCHNYFLPRRVARQ
jgi:hypothetical protein